MQNAQAARAEQERLAGSFHCIPVYSQGSEAEQGRDVALADVVERIGLRRIHILIVAAVWCCSAACCSVAIVSPYVVPAIQEEFSISRSRGAFGVGAYNFGCMSSVLFAGMLSDQMGRKTVLMYAMGGMTLFSMLSLLLPFASFHHLMLLRILVGIFDGAVVSGLTPYLLEFVSADDRRLVMCVANSGWPAGSALAVLSARHWEGHWRLILASSSLAGAVGTLLLYLSPETPRFLYTVGRTDEGYAVLRHIFASPRLISNSLEAHCTCPESVSVPNFKKHGLMTSLPHLLQTPHLHSLLATILVGITCAGADYSALFSFPEMLRSRLGMSDYPYNLTMCYPIGTAVGGLVAGALLDICGRKKFLFTTYIACVAVVALFGVAPSSYWVLVIIYIMLGAGQSMLWFTFAIYSSEAFPTWLRGTAVGLVYLFVRLSAFLTSVAASAMLDVGNAKQDDAGLDSAPNVAGITTDGQKAVLVFIGSFFVMGALGSLLIPRETSCQRLNDI